MRITTFIISLFVFFPFSSFAIHIVNIQGRANPEFLKFWTSNYLDWSLEAYGFLEKADPATKKFIKDTLETAYEDWGQLSHDKRLLIPNFQFIYESNSGEINGGVYLAVSTKLKADKAFSNILKNAGLAQKVEDISGIEIWPNTDVLKLHLVDGTISIYKKQRLIDTFTKSPPSFGDFKFFKRFTGDYRVTSQIEKKGKKENCYLMNIKTVSLLSLPAPMLDLVSNHKKQQSLTVRNIEECENGTFRILFP